MATSEPPVLARAADLRTWIARKSVFLFGPRQTGKSHLLRRTLPGARVYDLLDTAVYVALSQQPGRLADEAADTRTLIVIDEIQRLPALLNEVHRLIETRGLRFLLTGSSARSLRRGGVNLLGGRAREHRLHPLSAHELGRHFDLARVMAAGALPSIYFSDDPRADLTAYAGTYLQQEVAAEGATRNVPAFSRFLRVAALSSATIVNFTRVAGDAQVPRTTVYEYYDILRDTLLLHEVPAWTGSKTRKPIVSSKYYLFDVGVTSALQGRTLVPGTPEYGHGLESVVLNELVCHRDYAGGSAIRYWRSTSGFEVDFVLGDHTAVEVKASGNVTARDLRGLEALGEERRWKRRVCVALEARPRRIGTVDVLPFAEFVARLWRGELSE
jgi:predicted AAA+ superfamily ATPase